MADKPKAEEIDHHVGTSIRARRRHLGLAIAELARRSDFSPDQIRQHEAGESPISVATLWRIAEALDMPASVFLERIGTPRPARKVQPEPVALTLEMLPDFSMIRRDEDRDQVVEQVRSLVRARR